MSAARRKRRKLLNALTIFTTDKWWKSRAPEMPPRMLRAMKTLNTPPEWAHKLALKKGVFIGKRT